MSPFEELQMWHDQFQAFRRKMYWLVTIGFVLIITGFAVIAVSYVTGQQDIQRVGCGNSQSLIDVFEFSKTLATANQTGQLSHEQIQQRLTFYEEAEQLARRRNGDSCDSLSVMQARAKLDIQEAFKP